MAFHPGAGFCPAWAAETGASDAATTNTISQIFFIGPYDPHDPCLKERLLTTVPPSS